MKITTVLAAAGLALGATSSVLADYTFPSFNLAGDRAQVNTFAGLNLAGATPGLYSGYEILLDWTSTGNSPTNGNNAWSSEARSAFASAAGTGTGPTYPGGTTNYTPTVASPTNGASNANNVTNLRFAGNFALNYDAANPLFWNYRHSFAGFSTQDVTWSNIRITLKSYVPPAPPAVFTDLGNVGSGNDTMKMGTTAYVAGQVSWFKFTLTQAVPAAVASQWLSIDTFGSTLSATSFGPDDTEIALFDSTGAVVGNNDDFSGSIGGESLLTYGDLATSEWAGSTGTGVDNGALAAGVYYIAVSPFNMTASAGWQATVAPGSPAPVGDLKVTVKIPAPGSMALLGLGGLLATRRRRA